MNGCFIRTLNHPQHTKFTNLSVLLRIELRIENCSRGNVPEMKNGNRTIPLSQNVQTENPKI